MPVERSQTDDFRRNNESSGPRLTKACAKCRRQKLRCVPGATGLAFPCRRCEETRYVSPRESIV
jgi:hypothetical protein